MIRDQASAEPELNPPTLAEWGLAQKK